MAASLVAAHAFAFCRSTTCDVGNVDDHPECLPEKHDADECNLMGMPLFWPAACVGFGVQTNGSKNLGITWQTTDAIIEKAFQAWISADCGGGRHPSIAVSKLGEIFCPEIQFNKVAPNANVWLYRDDAWPYGNVDNALALTTVSFDTASGRILDADVEINSFGKHFTTSNTDVGNDLQAILTHEAGHFLGLAHEKLKKATMTEFYDGSRDFRTLESDDVQGICAVYPPDRSATACPKDGPLPLHGFSRYCADEENTNIARSELSMANGGCACSFDHSSGRIQFGTWVALVALGAGAARKGLRRPQRS